MGGYHETPCQFLFNHKLQVLARLRVAIETILVKYLEKLQEDPDRKLAALLRLYRDHAVSCTAHNLRSFYDQVQTTLLIKYQYDVSYNVSLLKNELAFQHASYQSSMGKENYAVQHASIRQLPAEMSIFPPCAKLRASMRSFLPGVQIPFRWCWTSLDKPQCGGRRK